MSTVPTAPHDELVADRAALLRWSWTMLGWQLEQRPDGSAWLHLPELQQAEVGGVAPLPIAPAAIGGAEPGASPEFAERLFATTMAALRAQGEALHAAPACQPVSVHQLSPRLFEAYTVEGGHVRLGGCVLEDQPLLRLTYRVSPAGSTAARLVHRFSTVEGQAVDEHLLDSLHVHDLRDLARPPRLQPGQLSGWLAAAGQQAPRPSGGARAELIFATVVWCKYFRCKLIFEIGAAQADLSFSSWAQWLIDGAVLPPPFLCRATGRQSYHVVATDDGRISVPEAIAVCQHSGRRALETDLQTCQLTGRRVLAEFLRTCPVSGQRLLATEMVSCSGCAQSVSPRAVTGGRCQACRSLRHVRRDDPRMARILGEHPRLDQWSRWHLSETESVYILSGSSFLRQLLVVLDKETLNVRRLSDSSCFSRGWSPIAEAQWGEFLR